MFSIWSRVGLMNLAGVGNYCRAIVAGISVVYNPC